MRIAHTSDSCDIYKEISFSNCESISGEFYLIAFLGKYKISRFEDSNGSGEKYSILGFLSRVLKNGNEDILVIHRSFYGQEGFIRRFRIFPHFPHIMFYDIFHSTYHSSYSIFQSQYYLFLMVRSFYFEFCGYSSGYITVHLSYKPVIDEYINWMISHCVRRISSEIRDKSHRLPVLPCVFET